MRNRGPVNKAVCPVKSFWLRWIWSGPNRIVVGHCINCACFVFALIGESLARWMAMRGLLYRCMYDVLKFDIDIQV